jgi:L-ribulose-5-phosphate 4-epimerase
VSGETGVVKFRCEHVRKELAPFAGFDELNARRRKLLQLRMVGIDANGIGYGNLSVRAGETNQFYITASGTGGRAQLSLGDYAVVTAYDFAGNWLRCEGAATASSESLTHAAVYVSDPQSRAVIHCHEQRLWRELLECGPATSGDVEYGTPEMAYEVQRLFRETNVREAQLFAMAGHADGIVAFGASVDGALSAIMRQLARARSS